MTSMASMNSTWPTLLRASSSFDDESLRRANDGYADRKSPTRFENEFPIP